MNTSDDNYPMFTKVSVIGLGYIGLPTAAILAAKKIQVVGVDVSQHVVDTINRGQVHFKEPELDIVVHAVVLEGYLRATIQPEPADAFLVAVPTPFTENYQPDLSYVKAASKAIASVLKKNDLVILESTCPVGATEQMATWLARARPDLTFPQTHGEQADIRIAYCPERVLPGHVLHELVYNDRIIGGMTSCCSARAMQLYQLFVEGNCLLTNSRTAELCKLTENSFRDVNIAFANELSMICDKLEINVWELIRLANHHPRVGILKPGPGVGGHCIAVDPWFIVSQTPDEARLIHTARLVNDSKPNWVIQKIQEAIIVLQEKSPARAVKDITIACFGLSFKPNVDDLRESPAVNITRLMALGHPGHVIAVEPNIQSLPAELSALVELQTIEQAVAEADILVKLVDHQDFRMVFQNLSPRRIVLNVCSEGNTLQ